ncbi:MAG: lipid II flippase MurJ, partial [Moraxellaceae bacterium]|nr:lipid II flippase MurJ [Moraxellaceae bacterium]
FMLIKVFAPCFYARQDVRTPVRIGVIAMVANMVFNLILVWELKHVGLSLASTLAAFLNAGLLYHGLRKAGIFRLERHWIRLGILYLGANAVMVTVLLLVMPGTEWWLAQRALYKVATILGICALGAGTYFAALLVGGFRLREIRHH